MILIIILSIIALAMSIDDFHRKRSALGTFELGLSFGIVTLIFLLIGTSH